MPVLVELASLPLEDRRSRQIMPLDAGTRLGRYAIRSQLGAGAMGEVYLAEDSQLRRAIALKLLPDDFTHDEDRLRRFQQEAYAASALNHPNIITIYEIGEVNDRHYIATEFIDGQSLREHISRARMRLSEALDISVQVAAALTAAHRAGIVHRDIKPENIMLRSDGYTKVLDFGLAKLSEPLDNTGANQSEAQTRALMNTEKGVVMGTPKYMSPEQSRGLQVDGRTDIWSLGCVLYEMVTGHVPFVGATHSDVIVSILDREPPPLAQHVPGIPAELQRIVRKSLRKDREERYQTVKDMALDLKNLRREMEAEAERDRSGQPVIAAHSGSGPTVTTPTANQSAAVSAARRTTGAAYLVSEIKRHKRGAMIASVALVILFAALGFGIYKFAGLGSSEGRASVPFQAMNMNKLTTMGKATDAAISPDGRYAVHVMDEGGKESLWVKQVKIASASQRIVEPADVYYGGLTFSPDGNYIYYVRAEKDNPGVGTLCRMPVLGGTPNKLVDNVRSRITFSPDGNRFAFVRRNPTTEDTALITANADGSVEQTIAARKLPDDFGGDDSGPAWSPDGKTLVCGAGNSVRNEMTVVEVHVKDGTDRPITSQTWFRVGQIAWLPDASGFIMLATPQQAFSYQIWHLSYPAGKAERISKDLNNYLSVSLTADGNSLVAVQNAAPSSIWIVPDVDVTRAKQITFGAGTGDGSYGLSWTPDGRIVYETNASGNEDIWIMNADGSNPKQLTANVRISDSPVVSPDGRYILSINDRTGVPHVWRMDIDGGNPKQLTNGRGEIPQGLSADSQWVVYTSIPDIGSGKKTLWRLPINGGESVPITDNVAGESRRTSGAGVSSDGKLIAFWYRGEETGSPKLRIIPFAGGEPVKTFDLPPETNRYCIRWRPDGRALTYAAARNGVWNIWSQPLEGNAPKQLTNWQSEEIFAFDWTHDGKELAIARGLQTNDVILISNSK